jgi:mRNA-degrading endonuclease toxin of MazEF toxin-antitoxin module
VVSPENFNDRIQDLVVAAITSQLTDQHAVFIEQGDCVDGTLPKTSVVKLAKLFTIHSTLVLKSICALRAEKLGTVLGEIRRFFS